MYLLKAWQEIRNRVKTLNNRENLLLSCTEILKCYL